MGWRQGMLQFHSTIHQPPLLQCENWKVVDNIELMAWIGNNLRAELEKQILGQLMNYLAQRQAPRFYRVSMSHNKFKEQKICI